MSQQVEGATKAFTAGEALEAFRRVKWSASETVVYADADDDWIGITQESAAVNDPVSVRLKNAEGTFKVVAAAAVTVGAALHGADDGKVDDDPAKGPQQFRALEAASGDDSVIEAIPLESSEGGLLFANLADSSEVENTDTETDFDVSKTIDGSTLEAGDVLEVVMRAFVLDNNSTDTLTLKLKVGTETIVTTGAVDVADSDIGYIHAFVVVRAAGASGLLSASGVQVLGVPGTAAALPFRKDEASEDLSGDVAIKGTATWSDAHADNEVLLEDLIVIRHRQ